MNGLGWPVSEAESEIQRLKSIYPIYDDIPAIYPEWERLVVKYQVVGKNAHDARLVAAMLVHKIAKILSFNQQDFQRYQEITALAPGDVTKAATP